MAPDVGNGFGLRISSAVDALGNRLSVEPAVGSSNLSVEQRAAPSLLPAAGGLSIVYVSGEPGTPGHQYRVERYAAAATANDCTVVWMRGDELPSRLRELWGADVLIIWRMS